MSNGAKVCIALRKDGHSSLEVFFGAFGSSSVSLEDFMRIFGEVNGNHLIFQNCQGNFFSLKNEMVESMRFSKYLIVFSGLVTQGDIYTPKCRPRTQG